jgi:hypothetical protein
MATTTKSASRSSDRGERGHRRLRDQPIAFLGLFLAPIAGLLVSWLIHAYTYGINWSVAGHRWVITGNIAALTVTIALVACGAIGMGFAAWHIAEHRRTPLRVMLTGSSSAIVWLFAISIGVGPHRWWSFAFVVFGWYVAGLWTLTRLNVTRQDPREPGEEKETWLDRLGLKGSHGKVRDQVRDAEGNLVRTVVDVQNAPGETVKPLQDAIPNLESHAKAPAGMSTAIGDPDRADRSTLEILHVDPLKKRLPYGPPSHPGGSIEDPLNIALYNNGHPMWCYLAGGPVAINPTGAIIMGTTRAGKTLAENLLYTEMGSRTDVVICYLNKAKGLQDLRPIAPVVEVAIVSDSDRDYSSAFERFKSLLSYRSRVLGEYGISAWTAGRCFHNPPQRKANGDPVPMEPMPFLEIHIGEADAVLDNYKSDDGAIYLASKGLSLGTATNWSLQRAGHDSMPTGLRENLGARFCFGTMTASATAMALSEPTIDAGAHPENWGARKPGYFYYEGPGVDETLYARFAKTYSLAPGADPRWTIEELSAAMSEEMLRRNRENAPRMAKLDRGSALATGKIGDACWWDVMARRTEEIRVQLGASANPSANQPANMTASDRKPTPQTPEAYPANREDEMSSFAVTATPQDAEDPDDVEIDLEIKAEIRNTDTVEGVELYPADEDGETAEGIDLSAPLETAEGVVGMSWADPRPAAPSRTEAILAVRETLVELLADPAKRDPDDETAALVQVADVTDRLKFKSRPWMSGVLSEMAAGTIDPPGDVTMTLADDQPLGNGRPNLYRLRRSRSVEASA